MNVESSSQCHYQVSPVFDSKNLIDDAWLIFCLCRNYSSEHLVIMKFSSRTSKSV